GPCLPVERTRADRAYVATRRIISPYPVVNGSTGRLSPSPAGHAQGRIAGAGTARSRSSAWSSRARQESPTAEGRTGPPLVADRLTREIQYGSLTPPPPRTRHEREAAREAHSQDHREGRKVHLE